MNVLKRYKAMAKYMHGTFLSSHFPEHYIQTLPYEGIKRGHCLRCKHPMTADQMHPPGRITPRAICPTCWMELTNQVTTECWVCGFRLDDHSIQAQSRNPRDLHHRVHQHDKCIDYFSLLSAHILGEQTGVIELSEQEANHNNPMTIDHITNRLTGGLLPQPQPARHQVIDVTPQPLALPQSTGGIKLDFEPQFKREPEPVRVGDLFRQGR